ncbi:MAG TPA: cytochrome C [Planctomycetaceae bacterium]|nr:cytochrome C [Planctomycetaceae bacterium]
MYYAGSPQTWRVGYSPKQPVPFSHALHAGQLGLDCRYCHTTVEEAATAALPPTSICMNCHERIAPKSDKLLLVRESFASGAAIPWVRVHKLPDFVYFDHSAHVRRGVSCVSCHGRVDQMEQVVQVQPLSMAWCLDCHRNPDAHLRPPDLVTDLGWVPEQDATTIGQQVRAQLNINPSTDCSTCHR